jgi:Tfp pilus assembly pilus retraction ATPase PilT
VSATAKMDVLLSAMIEGTEGISDLLFVPTPPPQIEVYGELPTPAVEWPAPPYDAEQIEQFARMIIGGSPKLLKNLKEHGARDCRYTLRDQCRFCVNIYRQKKDGDDHAPAQAAGAVHRGARIGAGFS